ncbi:hypothetical protein, partial [Parapedobacter sp.]
MIRIIPFLLLLALGVSACDKSTQRKDAAYADDGFIQDYSVKYLFSADGVQLWRARADRDGKIQLLASDGLKHLRDGRFLHPGSVVTDNTYRFMSAKSIVDMVLCQGEFVYLDKRVVFSNAWSGRLFVEHQLNDPTVFAGNAAQDFLVSDGRAVHFIRRGAVVWKGQISGNDIIEMVAHPKDSSRFFLLAKDA